MAGLTYILDTNAVADYINQFEPTTTQIKQAIRDGDDLYLCRPVEYEVLRGLVKTNATRKRRIFEDQFVPLLDWQPLIGDDWRQAAQLWANAVNRGK